jgi:small-conductance mechanosensitive channel
MDIFEAVETDAFEDDDESITRRQAVKSIESRFEMMRRFFAPIIILTGAILIILPHLSAVPAAYISLFAGSIAVLIGISAKPFIENLISGVVITLSQPIKINDTVRIDGKYGTVDRITFLYTVIKVWNWNRWVVPNHKLLQKEFENLSIGDEHEWAKVEFCVSPESDLDLVKKIAKNAMKCKYLNQSEPPSFWIMSMQPDHIKCWVAGWANNAAEAWALRSSTRRKLVRGLQAEGIQFHALHNKVSINSPALVEGGAPPINTNEEKA